MVGREGRGELLLLLEIKIRIAFLITLKPFIRDGSRPAAPLTPSMN
jgi:hypothetical protein